MDLTTFINTIIWFFVIFIIFINYLLYKIEIKMNNKDKEIAELEAILEDQNIEYDEIKQEKNILVDSILKIQKDFTQKFNKNTYKKSKLNKKDKKAKGDMYEKYIAEYFRKENYIVDERGLRLGRLDKGIDLVANFKDISILIQCKNFEENVMVNHSIVKRFNENCLNFVKENNLKQDKVKFLFVLPSKKSLKQFSIKYFGAKDNRCQYEIIKISDKVDILGHDKTSNYDKYSEEERKAWGQRLKKNKDEKKRKKAYTIKQAPDNMKEILKQSEERYKKRYENNKEKKENE